MERQNERKRELGNRKMNRRCELLDKFQTEELKVKYQ
jgi:hypothetical protein